MNDEDRRLGRLLSGEDIPSPAEEDLVLQRVLASQPAASTSKVRSLVRLILPAASAGLATAAAVFFILQTPETEQLTGRGGPTEGALELTCEPGPRCERGDTLMLRVQGGPEAGYLAAFAQGDGGQVIWYFPQTAQSQSVPFTSEQWVEKGIRLGQEHRDGTYSVYVYLSSIPLDRAAVVELAEGDAIPDTVSVLKNTFIIEP